MPPERGRLRVQVSAPPAAIVAMSLGLLTQHSSFAMPPERSRLRVQVSAPPVDLLLLLP